MTIPASALVAAATLSNRYITGRQLPDKAIDLIDEAASRLRMELDSSPVEIDGFAAAWTVCAWRSYLTEVRPGGSLDQKRPKAAEQTARRLADREESLRALTARWEAESWPTARC